MVGRSDKAVYTAKDGRFELTGNPRVQQGLNTHVATSPDTVMILNEAGQLETTRSEPDGNSAGPQRRIANAQAVIREPAAHLTAGHALHQAGRRRNTSWPRSSS